MRVSLPASRSKQGVGLIDGTAGVLGEVGRRQGDLGSGWRDEMMEDGDGRLALFIRQVPESPLDMGSDDRPGSAEMLERLPGAAFSNRSPALHPRAAS